MSEREPAAPGGPAVPQPAAKPSWADLPPSAGGAPGVLPASAFTVRRFLGMAFSTWWSHALRFTGVALLFHVPLAALTSALYWTHPALVPDPQAGFFAAYQGEGRFLHLATTVASWGVAAVAMGAIVHGAWEHLHGREAPFGAMVRVGVRRFPSVLLLEIAGAILWPLTGLVVTAPLTLFLLASWAVSVPAILVEGRGPIDGMARSWRLTRGLRWQVLGGLLVVGAAFYGCLLVFGSVGGFALVAARSSGHYARLVAEFGVASSVLGSVAAPGPIVATAVMFRQLREAAEGPAAAQLGQVFE